MKDRSTSEAKREEIFSSESVVRLGERVLSGLYNLGFRSHSLVSDGTRAREDSFHLEDDRAHPSGRLQDA